MIPCMETHAKANALIISLILHLMLLLVLLNRQYEQPITSFDDVTDISNEVPVIFEETPSQQITQQLIPPQPAEEPKQQSAPDKPLKNMMADFFDGEPTAHQAPPPVQEKKVEQFAKSLETQKEIETPEANKPIQQNEPEPSDSPLDNQITSDEGIPFVVHVPKKELPTPNTKEIKKIKQQTLTLADLVQGFLSQNQLPDSDRDSDANGGMHVLKVKTGKHGHASEKQLMHELYYKKIIACIGNSFKIHRHKAPQTDQSHRAAIQLAIKRDGSLYSLQLLQSSGNRAIDDFALFILKDASLSFPPVPKFFDTDVYTFIPFAFDNIFDFGYPEAWMIGPVNR